MFFVDQALAYRLESAQARRMIAYAQVIQQLHPDIQTGAEAVGGGYAIFSGEDFPVNRAVGLGLQGLVNPAELDRVEQFYSRHNLPPRVDLCPLADLSLLILLGCRGYRLESLYSVLVYPLTDGAASVAWPESIRISQAEPEEARLWLTTVAQGFEESESPPPETLDILAPNFYSDHTTAYFAWIEGQPAGGAAMLIHEGVVELGGASTRPAFRQRGVQTALVQARLAAARAQGCDLAMALTLPGTVSQRNLERAGFRLAYTKMVLAGPS
jgi:GNAT superfamily N-acetyltransferase